MKIYLTKYALSTGVIKHEVTPSSFAEYALHHYPKDYAKTPEELSHKLWEGLSPKENL
jgi:hypothetical protein